MTMSTEPPTTTGQPDHDPVWHDPVWEVTPLDVKGMLERGDRLLLIDCRGPDETEVQTISGSRIIPMQSLSLCLEELRTWEADPVVVYCRSGSRSRRVVATLRQIGFRHAHSMAGGINRWSRDVDPTIQPY
ncbi:MAG: rhodanese-like domain-containing protein [Phycisphaeraceae bacterium]|nr:rhodanese-like domain-containing protein [Phycisphaeraceae bacterium]